MKYRADIDGLRALAVLLVVGYHGAPDIVAKGFIGVDIFFVISGYLITHIILERVLKGEFSIWWFFSRRIKRLFPALILVMLFVLIFGWFSLLAEEYDLLGKHVVGGAFFVANFLFAAEVGYFDVSALYKPLLHLWSLAVEEQFYLFFPGFLLFLYACRANIMAILLVAFVCSLLFGIYEASVAPGRAFFLPLARFWELLAGGILACGTLRWGADISTVWHRADRYLSDLIERVGLGAVPSVRAATLVSGAGFLFIAGALFLIPDGVAYPGVAAMLPVAGAFFIIMAGPEAGFNRILLTNRPAIWFGLISYPLYLWHWPVLSFMAIVDGDLPHRDARLIAMCSCVLLAWATYQFIEKYIRHHHSNTVVPALLLVTITLTGAGGGMVYIVDGVKERKWLQNEFSHNGDIQSLHPEYKRGSTWICPRVNAKGAICTSTGERPSVVVIGDSHALATYAVLRHIYRDKELDIGLVGIGGCPSLLGVVSHDPGTSDTRQCPQYMDFTLNTILEQKHVKHIVLSNRIALYVNGTGFGRKERGLSGWVFHKNGEKNKQMRVDVFFDALRDTVRRAHEAGKRISIVHGTPELGFDVKSCAPLRPYVMKPARKVCAIKRSEFESRTRSYRERLAGFLREHPEVGSANISSALCDAELCYGAGKGILYYMDDDHLSRWGALHVSEHVARELGELTGRIPDR